MPITERIMAENFGRQTDGELDDTIRIDTKRDRRHMKYFGTQLPSVGAADSLGAALGATAGKVAIWDFGLIRWEMNQSTAQTLFGPTMGTAGLDVSLDLVDNECLELVPGGNSLLSPLAFTIGTDAFFQKFRLKISDVSGADFLQVGFRKVEAYAATGTFAYTDHAAIGSVSGDIKLDTLLNNAGGVVTDTTDNWADAETKTLGIYVSAAGVVTYTIDGVAPTVTAAFTFDSGDVVIPYFALRHDADVANATQIVSWEVGLQGY